ncbi:hypothetical protein Pla163_14240 [Planctomycetes bacterium Pla163]|uniref:Uncharacterized protein n=1 Tax=Rohdeia mirabilis TaxID=2528008 RepID=A0A518CYN4_9BACT|nr:hypothetical protein Pla163_14240 [Planctomycetes bacterium Pla163]
MKSAICFTALCAGLVLWQFPCAFDCLARGVAGAYDDVVPARTAASDSAASDSAESRAAVGGSANGQVRRELGATMPDRTSATKAPVVQPVRSSSGASHQQVLLQRPSASRAASTDRSGLERAATASTDSDRPTIDTSAVTERTASIVPGDAPDFDVAPH